MEDHKRPPGSDHLIVTCENRIFALGSVNLKPEDLLQEKTYQACKISERFLYFAHPLPISVLDFLNPVELWDLYQYLGGTRNLMATLVGSEEAEYLDGFQARILEKLVLLGESRVPVSARVIDTTPIRKAMIGKRDHQQLARWMNEGLVRQAPTIYRDVPLPPVAGIKLDDGNILHSNTMGDPAFDRYWHSVNALSKKELERYVKGDIDIAVCHTDRFPPDFDLVPGPNDRRRREYESYKKWEGKLAKEKPEYWIEPVLQFGHPGNMARYPLIPHPGEAYTEKNGCRFLYTAGGWIPLPSAANAPRRSTPSQPSDGNMTKPQAYESQARNNKGPSPSDVQARARPDQTRVVGDTSPASTNAASDGPQNGDISIDKCGEITSHTPAEWLLSQSHWPTHVIKLLAFLKTCHNAEIGLLAMDELHIVKADTNHGYRLASSRSEDKEQILTRQEWYMIFADYKHDSVCISELDFKTWLDETHEKELPYHLYNMLGSDKSIRRASQYDYLPREIRRVQDAPLDVNMTNKQWRERFFAEDSKDRFSEWRVTLTDAQLDEFYRKIAKEAYGSSADVQDVDRPFPLCGCNFGGGLTPEGHTHKQPASQQPGKTEPENSKLGASNPEDEGVRTTVPAARDSLDDFLSKWTSSQVLLALQGHLRLGRDEPDVWHSVLNRSPSSHALQRHRELLAQNMQKNERNGEPKDTVTLKDFLLSVYADEVAHREVEVEAESAELDAMKERETAYSPKERPLYGAARHRPAKYNDAFEDSVSRHSDEWSFGSSRDGAASTISELHLPTSAESVWVAVADAGPSDSTRTAEKFHMSSPKLRKPV